MKMPAYLVSLAFWCDAQGQSLFKMSVRLGDDGSPGIQVHYRGTLHIRNSPPPGPYGRPMPRALWRS